MDTISTEQQIFQQLTRASRVLIALPKVLHADTLGSALALKLFLKKLDKEVDIVTSAALPEQLEFLPGAREIKHELNSDKTLVVVLNTSKSALKELSYQTSDDK